MAAENVFHCRNTKAFKAPFKNKRIWLERIEKFVSPTYFSDVNLYSKLYKDKANAVYLGHISTGFERFVKYKEVVRKSFSPVKTGCSFGPAWSTHWFKIQFEISEKWIGEEVRFRWNSSSEAMVWKDGKPLQGLTGGDGQVRTDFIITEKLLDAESVTLYVEMAANGMFGAGRDGLINPPDPNRTFTLSMVEVAVIDKNVLRVIRDLNLLIGMVKELPEDSQRLWQALYTANDIVNCFQPQTEDSFERAFDILNEFFNQKNGDSQHLIHAIGHCHIDSAWLWPYDESIRKCARSWSSTVGLMKRYPNFKFACSQAQQFEWVRLNYPSIYEEIKNFVAKGQFIPVGGTWVEMDGNIPSGESFVRQFLFGQKFFQSEFGKKCSVFWLPDTFGYSAQLPQIIRQCGIKYFVTQKLSWNLINKFPHNSFLWEGIDGTRCLTHFPPADTYESSAGVNDILKSSTKNKEMGRINDSMLLFGYGDGGGGPTEEMIENLERMRNVDGLPRVEFSSPVKMFEKVENDIQKLNVWVGELYLELHQGTFTTNSVVKSWNKRCEIQLQKTEFLSTIAWICGNKKQDLYPKSELDRVWKLLLLNQFHDVLPGTSITQVYDDAVKYYKDIQASTSSLDKKAVLLMKNEDIHTPATSQKKVCPRCCLLNTCSWTRKEVVEIPSTVDIRNIEAVESTGSNVVLQRGHDYNLGLFEVPSMGFARLKPLPIAYPAEIKMVENVVYLSNGLLESSFDKSGRLLSLKLTNDKREAIAKPMVGNQFIIYDDIPLFWDAWDVMPYYKETRKPLDDSYNFRILDEGPLRVLFEVEIKISERSSLRQQISLCAHSEYIKIQVFPNWNENRKLLRVEFPVDVHSSFYTREIQFGHIKTPNNANTSWDWAKYEVCGHKWVDISEHDFGVSLLSSAKYGYSFAGNVIGISLLRSPKAPDDHSDMDGSCPDFSYAIMPHKGSFQSAGVVQQAYQFSNPLYVLDVLVKEDLISKSLFAVDSPAVVLETVKKAEDVDDAIIVRMYEAFGGRVSTNFKCSFSVKSVARCNLLEELHENTQQCETQWDEVNGCELDFRPFEIISLMLHLN